MEVIFHEGHFGNRGFDQLQHSLPGSQFREIGLEVFVVQ